MSAFLLIRGFQGPAFVPSGIFKPAYLVTLPETPVSGHLASASHPLLVSTSGNVFIEESSLEILKVGQTSIATANQKADWLLNVTLAVRSTVVSHSPSIVISIPELGFTSQPFPTIPALSASTIAPTILNAHFTIPDGVPERWFPHNLGSPKLYNVTITLNLSKTSSVSFVTRTGFRTIELVQTPYSQADVDARGITPGDQWHFEINGKPFYSSGTNIIVRASCYATRALGNDLCISHLIPSMLV